MYSVENIVISYLHAPALPLHDRLIVYIVTIVLYGWFALS